MLAVFDAKGKIVEQDRFVTSQDYEQFRKDLAESAAKLTTHDIKASVIAVPGRIDRTQGIALAFGSLPWTNITIQEDVKAILKVPVLLENDAKLAALSEAILLRKAYRKVLYLTISTGIGAGIIIDDRIDPDFQDMEVGQMLLEYEGRLTDWEDFASGRAFQKRFGKRVSETPADDTEAWYWFARNIAVGLVDLIATLTPEVIILGGGAGAHLEKFQDRLIEELEIYENPMFAIPPILKSQRAEEAVIYGCYELAKRTYEKIS